SSHYLFFLLLFLRLVYYVFIFFHCAPPSVIYTLSLHDALPICHLPDVLNITEIKNPYILLVPVMGYILYVLLRKIKFPAALLLGPIFVTIAWNLTTEITFTLDQFLIAFAQILFGIRIGLQITTLMKELSFKDILAIVIQNVGLILGT